MTEVVHADIFFFIASLATVLFAAVLLIGGYYVVRILRDVSEIVAKVNKASGKLEQDFDSFRNEIKNEGIKVRTIVDLGLGFLLSRMKKRSATRKPKVVDAEEDTLQ